MSTVPFNRTRSAPLPPEIEKKLPSNIDAEKILLGAIVMDGIVNGAPNKSLQTVRDALQPEDFFLSQHRRIFRNILFMEDSQQTIDTIMLIEALEKNRELEEAGGAPYLSSLTDGVTRLSETSLVHYAQIIKEKSRLRHIIFNTQKIQQDALEGYTAPDELNSQLETLSKEKSKPTNPAVVVSFRNLLTMELPALNYLFEPLLTEGGTGEIWGWRGTGKSFLATEMAMGMALGKPTLFPNTEVGGGNWPISRAYRVLYVYGEMHASQIKERAVQIANGHGTDLPTHEGFGLLSKDFQKNWRPRVRETSNRKYIDDRVFGGGYEVLILDNLSTLWPTAQDGEGERTAVLSDWFADLNQRGVSVIYLHHAGKGGDQRGGSEKEDMLDFVISLKNPPGYKRKEQLRVDVEVTKIRGQCRKSSWLEPFEVSLTTDRGATLWLMRPSEHAKFRACFEHFNNGMKPGTDLANEITASRASTYRWHKKYQVNQNPEYWIDLNNL